MSETLSPAAAPPVVPPPPPPRRRPNWLKIVATVLLAGVLLRQLV